jgi:hypothetical protein
MICRFAITGVIAAVVWSHVSDLTLVPAGAFLPQLRKRLDTRLHPEAGRLRLSLGKEN